MISFFSQLAQFGGGGITPPVPNWNDNDYVNNLTTQDGTLSTMELVISNMIGLLTILGGLFFIVAMLLGAMDWITAGGDSGKVQKARDRMIQGALGLVVIVAAYAIVGLVGGIVGFNILTPGALLLPLLPG